MKQNGPKVTVQGYAQSNARVSTFMRNIEASPWLGNPELIEIKLVPAPGAPKERDLKINEFTMSFLIKRAATTEAKLAPGTPAPAAAPPAKAPPAKTKAAAPTDGKLS